MISSSFLRYGKLFFIFRQLVKNLLIMFYPLINYIYKFPRVESVFDTLKKLQSNKSLSLVRFGDGEILYINDRMSLPFQKFDLKLANCFKDLLENKHEKLLVGLPIGYHDITTMSKEGQIFWKSQIVWNYPRLKRYLNMENLYANASVTRITYGFDKNYTEKAIVMWKRILIGDEVLLIEGEKTRFGVGNDLLSGFNSIQRIIAPKHDAFERCDQIISYITNILKKYDTILIALGPAAKYLVFELYKKGYQCIDIGNLDIEYEWFLRNGFNERTAIPGKYTSEARGGREVGEHPDRLAFEQYKREIIASFA